jgi:hypothetical protein
MVKILDDFFLKIKQSKFLNGHITYQSHMSISMFKPSTYACLWPIEFCQIVVTLVRIFSCFHDWDHTDLHIHANSYTGSYGKHAIHHLELACICVQQVLEIWPSRPQVREEYTTSFMHILGTNKVPWVVLQFFMDRCTFRGKRNQCATRARHGRTTRHGWPC